MTLTTATSPSIAQLGGTQFFAGTFTPTLSATAGPTVVLGTAALTASATLSGGNRETGNITFTLFDPSGNKVDTETVSVSGNGSYTTPTGYLPRVAGAYQWVTSYSGDSGNRGPSTTFGSTPQSVVGAGVGVVGTSLYLIGGNTNDQVNIAAAGVSKTGSTGVQVTGKLNGANVNIAYAQAFTTIFVNSFGGNDHVQEDSLIVIATLVRGGEGNDQVTLGNGNNSITLGNGNNQVQFGDGTNVVVLGNGNDHVQGGNGNNHITLGNGNDQVLLGDGTNVVLGGNGNNNIQAGNGNNLIAGGLGHTSIQVGNGRNILIDGRAQLTSSTDSLDEVLSDWVQYGSSASNVASIRSRLKVTYNTGNANKLKAGSGLDWFWATYGQDDLNAKATDVRN